MRSGGRPPSRGVDARAHRGAAARSRGASAGATATRRRPASLAKRCPASRPASRRMPVPALPQSSGCVGAAQAVQADAVDDALARAPALRCARPAARRIAAPSRACPRLRGSRRRASVPVGDRAEHHRAMRDRLVAGHAHLRRAAAPPRRREPVERGCTAAATRRAPAASARFSSRVPTVMRRQSGRP